jgi:hypothetical protein
MITVLWAVTPDTNLSEERISGDPEDESSRSVKNICNGATSQKPELSLW